MADIDLDTLCYRKTEVDSLITTEENRSNAAIALKADQSDVGSPSGIGTLSASGTTTVSQIPFATTIESQDSTNEITVMNPKQTSELIDIKATQIDATLDITADNIVSISTTPTIITNYNNSATDDMVVSETNGTIATGYSGRYNVSLNIYGTSSIADEILYIDVYDTTNNIVIHTTLLSSSIGAANTGARYSSMKVVLQANVNYVIRLYGDTSYTFTVKTLQFAIESINRDTV